MSDRPVAQAFGDVVVVGGGCYGSYYVRQLQRATRAGAVTAHRLIVVDRDAACRVVAQLNDARHEPWPLPVVVQQQDWREFFASYLAAACDHGVGPHDAIVPSPLMPHLMAEWLIERARSRWPTRTVRVEPIDAVPDVPWSRAGADATRYVSFATWMCPVNCIEPHVCPHTRGDRTWSLPLTISAHARRRQEIDAGATSVVLHCTHRAYGVGMFDTADVVGGDRAIAAAAERGRADILIGTVSHCHGALTRVVISRCGEPGSSADH